MRRFKKKKFYRINRYIQAKEVRAIDEAGKQIGVMPLEKALFYAQNKGLDLVEIAPNVSPPVCKIIDFKKFKYQEAKKSTAQKRKKSEIKEIRLSPFIAQNDLKNRLEKARKFLKSKNQVRVSIFFKGRQIAKKEFGYQLLNSVTEKLGGISQVGQEPKFMGRRLVMILNPHEKKRPKNKIQNKKVDPKKV